ncbi:transposase [Aerococcaceae bacterium INB8]|uniref:Transposase n=1 Tax=Ruoffia halotolerans TaxID=2748684 RepID=A0A839A3A1_9LACT|nr:IS3 family transposase [Ruoffia halotolerans]MBA5728619.1 transposase [Ruoffia halotolerans]
MTELPESTYHYHIAKKTNPHKDKELEDLIQAIFEEHKERYGYRRITIELRARGYKVNHKRVLRIMRQLGLQCLKFTNRSRRYNSYKGPGIDPLYWSWISHPSTSIKDFFMPWNRLIF